MWGFKQKPAVVALSNKLAVHLGKECGLNGEAAAALRMMEEQGHYVGRKVTFFRVFDPTIAEAAGVKPRCFRDLDAYAVAHHGHIESDGQIILYMNTIKN